jgi:hypothetical protein
MARSADTLLTIRLAAFTVRSSDVRFMYAEHQ